MTLDPRGPRFVAAVTTVVLAVGLVTESWIVLGLQAVVFAIGALVGPHASPYAWVFKTLIRPRLAPPVELEHAAPVRFAQAVGLAFAVVATIGFATGAEWLGLVATAFALGAAFLNAAFGFCLGCEMYVLIRRLTGRSTERLVPAGRAAA
jgi:hypothetical protein